MPSVPPFLLDEPLEIARCRDFRLRRTRGLGTVCWGFSSHRRMPPVIPACFEFPPVGREPLRRCQRRCKAYRIYDPDRLADPMPPFFNALWPQHAGADIVVIGFVAVNGMLRQFEMGISTPSRNTAAPGLDIDRQGPWAVSVSGTASCRAKVAVVSQLGIATTRKPFAMRAATASTANAAVDPLPSPRTIPSCPAEWLAAAHDVP